MSSCASVDVSTDYAENVDFSDYNTFAFYKPGIDKAEISDLDKRRILRAIENELSKKGMMKSQNPDVLISIITDAEKNVNVYQNNFGWGWGWNPFFMGGAGFNNVSTSVDGILFIDVIDEESRELVWQGMGKAYLSENREDKIERIKLIVQKILEEYPPMPKPVANQ
ncbi:MAG: DUF4136 domain-containing protein [Psychroflexus sp.]|nr:DUF4136 domain-containing protein [Psychroflexus sp.]MDR9448003.1 DUF4136 domain-containing protein [Psychroflexus sp.]